MESCAYRFKSSLDAVRRSGEVGHLENLAVIHHIYILSLLDSIICSLQKPPIKMMSFVNPLPNLDICRCARTIRIQPRCAHTTRDGQTGIRYALHIHYIQERKYAISLQVTYLRPFASMEGNLAYKRNASPSKQPIGSTSHRSILHL